MSALPPKADISWRQSNVLLNQRRIGSWECWEAFVGPLVLPDGVVVAPAVKEFRIATERKNVFR